MKKKWNPLLTFDLNYQYDFKTSGITISKNHGKRVMPHIDKISFNFRPWKLNSIRLEQIHGLVALWIVCLYFSLKESTTVDNFSVIQCFWNRKKHRYKLLFLVKLFEIRQTKNRRKIMEISNGSTFIELTCPLITCHRL